MPSAVLLVGFFVAPLASLLVYADATRRGLSRQERLLWASVVGAGSLGGFLLPSLYGDVLLRAYLYGAKSTPVVTSPYELSVVRLVVGVAAGAASLLLYGFGVRYGARRAA